MLYGAVHGPASIAPANCCWLHQILVPLTWIQAVLKSVDGELERRFTLEAYLRQGAKLTITTDASPYGLGAVLEQNGQIVSFFASAISPTDRRALALSDEPSSSDQQVLEAFAVLVALREWASYWRDRRVVLSVKSDNIATLTLVCKMQPHSDRMAIIAREIALDVGHSSVAPDDAIHIPGIANTAADALPVASSRENPKPYHPTLHPTSSGLHPPVPGNGGNPFPPLKPQLSVRKGQEWGGEHTSHPGQNQSYCRHSIYRTRNYLPVIGLPPPAPPPFSVPCFLSVPCVWGGQSRTGCGAERRSDPHVSNLLCFV